MTEKMQKPSYAKYIYELQSLKSERTQLRATYRQKDAELEIAIQKCSLRYSQELEAWRATQPDGGPSRRDLAAQQKYRELVAFHNRARAEFEPYHEKMATGIWPEGEKFDQSTYNRLWCKVNKTLRAVQDFQLREQARADGNGQPQPEQEEPEEDNEHYDLYPLEDMEGWGQNPVGSAP